MSSSRRKAVWHEASSSARPAETMAPVRLRLAAAILALCVGLGLGALAARAADPDALWKIVHGHCVPDADNGDPAPCALVTANDAVLKDINGATQFLLIPTARVTGIEDPAVLAPGAPNYFADAWSARRFVEAKAGHALPRDAVALAINPPGARSQGQLHIHVDCIRPGIRNALRALPIGTGWAPLPAPLGEQRYAAMRWQGDALDRNPFDALAGDLPGARAAMGQYTLVLAGTKDGFILLAGRIGQDGNGHGEDLQDHGCALAAHGPA